MLFAPKNKYKIQQTIKMKAIEKFKNLRNDTQIMLVSFIIFLFFLIIFIIYSSISTDNGLKDTTYTFEGNATISLNKSTLNNSRENMYKTFICEYSEAYDRCNEVEKFLLSKVECCNIGFCCD